MIELLLFGTQFLITTGENLDYLDGVHTVFGEVTEGMDVLAKINETFVDNDFIPYQDIRWDNVSESERLTHTFFTITFFLITNQNTADQNKL